MFGTVQQAARLLRPTLIANLRRIPARNMPVCTIDTNLAREAVPADLASNFSKVIAQTLKKPESSISVVVRADTQMCRAGSDAPGAQVQIWSIGVFDEERNPKYAKTLYDFLLPILNMSHDRVTILFHPIVRNTAGHLLYVEQLAGTNPS